MNRGFVFYFGKGMRTAAGVLLKGGQYLQYYVYFFMRMLGICIPVFGAIFPVADVRRAKIVAREKELTVTRAFGGVETGSSFGTALLAGTIKFLVLLGGTAALCGVGALLWHLGGYVGKTVDMTNPDILAAVFTAPAALAALVYAVAVLLLFAPLSYVLDSNKKIGATAALTASEETMRQGGKVTCFLNTAIPLLIKLAFAALAVGVMFPIARMSSETASMVLTIVWILIVAVVYLVFAPLFTVASDVANACLFQDISLDPAAMNNRTKGLFITRCRTENSLQSKGRDERLEDLFEKSGEAVTPPDTKYVPPTDWQERMGVYDPAADPKDGTDGSAQTTGEGTQAASAGADDAVTAQTAENTAGEKA